MGPKELMKIVIGCRRKVLGVVLVSCTPGVLVLGLCILSVTAVDVQTICQWTSTRLTCTTGLELVFVDQFMRYRGLYFNQYALSAADDCT